MSPSMLFLLLAATFAALFSSPTHALTESAASAFDSYVPRLGVPLASNFPSRSVSPRYHRLLPHGSGNVQGGKAQTAIFTATDAGVVGAVNPRNGNVVWRQQLDDEIQGFYLDGETAVVVTGQGGEKIHMFHALTGWNLWSKQLIQQGKGRLSNGEGSLTQRDALPGSDVVFVPTPEAAQWDVIVLSNGDNVTRLEVENGRELWTYSRTANGYDSATSPAIRILATSSTHVHILALVPASSGGSTFGLQHQVLSAQTGALLYTHDLQGVAIDRMRGAADVVPFTFNPNYEGPSSAASPPAPHVVWRQNDGTVRASPLHLPPLDPTAAFNPKRATPQIVSAKDPGDTFDSLRSVSMHDHGYLIATKPSGKAEVIQLKKTPGGAKTDRKLSSLWEFEEEAPDAVYSGSLDRSGAPYIDRVFFQRSQHLLNFHVFWATANDGEGQVTGFSFRWDHDLHGDVLASPFEVSPVGPFQLITRSAFATQSGSFQMIHEDRHSWIREEGQTATEHAAFVDVPRRARPSGSDVDSEDALNLIRNEGPVARVIRHVKALQTLPQRLIDTTQDVIGSARHVSKAQTNAVVAAADGLPPPPPQAGMPAREIHPKQKSAATAASPQATPGKSKSGKPQEDEEPPVDSVAPRTINATTVANLASDKWGLRQLMISASTRGKLYAQDTGLKSQYVWEQSLFGFGQGQGLAVPKVDVKYLGLVRPAHSGNGGQHVDPLMYAVATIEQPDAPTVTHVWEFNPLTGEFVGNAMTGMPLAAGDVSEVRKIKGEETIAAVGSQVKKVNIWPAAPETIAGFAKSVKETPFYHTEVSASKDRLVGYTLSTNFTPSRTVPLYSHWSWQLPEDERVVSTHQSSVLTDLPIAQRGRDLNDWFLSKAPKLLDPSVLVVVTWSTSQGRLTVHLVDQSTGGLLDTTIAPHQGEIDIARGVAVNFEENWLVVGYSIRNVEEVTGSRLLSIEYYDRNAHLERSLSNWFSKSLTPRADINSKDAKARGKAISTRRGQIVSYNKVYILPNEWRGVQSLSLSRTLHNAADRALLVLTGTQELASIPRRWIDPRRPFAKGSADQQAVGKQTRWEADFTLQPYDAYLPFDATRLLTHGIDLTGRAKGVTKAPRVLSTATKLESTTLVAVIGTVDFFLTKLATASPAGGGGAAGGTYEFDVLSSTFNKFQLVSTIAVLALGILVTQPVLRGKVLKQRWV